MTDATAATRAVRLLRELASASGPLPATTLARRLVLPRSSVYHLLAALRAEGFVVHYPEDGRWGLGVSVFEVGAAYLRHEPLERLGRPVLHRMVQKAERIAPSIGHLGVLHGRETVYLARESTTAPVTAVVEVGVRLPASLTASGRCMLAHLPANQVRALFPDRASFIDRTGAGPTSPTALRRMLTEERERGWASEDGYVVEGYASVAAAAVDRGGRPAASIGLTFRVERVDVQARQQLAELTASAASALTRRLGG